MQSPQAGAPLSILVVDDEELLAKSCVQILSSEGYEVRVEHRGRAALEHVRRSRPDVVLADLMLPDVDGVDLLREIKQISSDILVIMITGFATVDSSVEAIQAGAYDYLPKPFTATHLRVLIGRAAQQIQLARDNAALRSQLKQHYAFQNMVGASDAMARVFEMISRVAVTDASVLISGESGTGKELVARAIHTASRRSDRPFVAVNCAALPDHLLESELFGHEKGAFTGAETQRRGLIESAAGGTFFLDEVSEMSLDLQAKLLRVVQERKVRRVGGDGEVPVDVRWVSATNRDPQKAAADGALRQDLLFRLNVVPLRLPPLRERRGDIAVLAQHFLRHFAQQYERSGLRFTPEALRVLSEQAWPGNVRELQNVVERVVSLGTADHPIDVPDLPDEYRGPLAASVGQGWSFSLERPFHEVKTDVIAAFEQKYLVELLARHDGNISQAAREAEIDRKTIHRMLQKYDLN